MPTPPIFKAALLCERLLQEADGAISAIRIIDRMSVEIEMEGGDPEAPKPAIPADLSVLVAIVRGKAAEDTHKLGIAMASPSGKSLPPQYYPMRFVSAGEEATTSMLIQMRVIADEDGLYWIKVSIDDAEVSRLPLRLERSIVARKPSGSPDSSTK
jgi:hypothetical protein